MSETTTNEKNREKTKDLGNKHETSIVIENTPFN